jgi:hypothetical protein
MRNGHPTLVKAKLCAYIAEQRTPQFIQIVKKDSLSAGRYCKLNRLIKVASTSETT